MEWMIVVAVLLLNINTEDHTLILRTMVAPDQATCFAITTDKGANVFMGAANRVFISQKAEVRAVMAKGKCILVQKI